MVKENNIMKCPCCSKTRFINRISKTEFFCVNCLIELKIKEKKLFIIESDEEGNIKNLKEVAAV